MQVRTSATLSVSRRPEPVRVLDSDGCHDRKDDHHLPDDAKRQANGPFPKGPNNRRPLLLQVSAPFHSRRERPVPHRRHEVPLTMNVTLRDARTRDLAILGDVFRRASLSNRHDREVLLQNPSALEFDPSSLTAGRVRVAIDAAGDPIAFVTTVGVNETAELVDLFVDPDWMRQGIGRALVTDVVSFCGAHGISRIGVCANPHALAFYEKVGFLIDGTEDTEFGPGIRMHLDVALAGGPAYSPPPSELQHITAKEPVKSTQLNSRDPRGRVSWHANR